MTEEEIMTADVVTISMAAKYLKQPPQAIRIAMRHDKIIPSIGFACPPEDGRTEWSYHIVPERLIRYKKGQ